MENLLTYKEFINEVAGVALGFQKSQLTKAERLAKKAGQRKKYKHKKENNLIKRKHE